MSLEPSIALAANVAIALSFIAAIVFGIVQTRAAARDRKERLTLETLRIFHTRDFAEIIHTLRVTDVPATKEGFEALPDTLQMLLIQSSQQMESIGMLVYEKYIDLDLVDKTIGSFVSNSWEKYKPLFLDMRQKLPDPYLGEYFQWLAERVDERINEGRAPYYLTNNKRSFG
jgi:hypothetical protein